MNTMLTVTEVTEETQEQARRIVCAGLEERFGELDPSCNKDLDDIVSWYAGQGHLFLTGTIEGQLTHEATLKQCPDTSSALCAVVDGWRMSGMKQQRTEEEVCIQFWLNARNRFPGRIDFKAISGVF
ncbi:hypothetical protein ACFCP7_01210 [Paenibacillus elgii]